MDIFNASFSLSKSQFTESNYFFLLFDCIENNMEIFLCRPELTTESETEKLREKIG